ncbi:ribonucleoside triphosphate reductase [Candidatus Parabeggiatoa sp. HSG14]|uniref:ribonucleoside triphosphate reductase n=1 Tax=Candidatus Parabeggiatoa sp. HSG14 TaxID=3055593 RepID=UPI0025A7F0DA|nr:ribonucleoside triphosphate reductase [Thiotrichales bacterium HSG14]
MTKTDIEPTNKNEQPSDEENKNLINVKTSVEEYLSEVDWRVKANANQGYSLGGLILNVSGKVIANYWLNQIYTPEIAEAHRNGDMHIHDLDMLAGYCAGWALRSLLAEGFNGIPGKVEAKPPKHLSSAIGQMVNFLGTLQNEWAGAQAFSSTDSYLAPYIRKDKLPYKQVKQYIQELIYNLNVPSRWGCVPLDTEILTTAGWKLKDDISISDKVYGFKNGHVIEDEILAINVYDFEGELIAFSNRSQEQLLTPNHRVLRLGYNDNKNKFFVDEAEALFKTKSPINVPIAGHIVQEEYAISDDLLQSYASKEEMHIDILRKCSERQIKLFIDTYRKGEDEKERFRITTKDEKIKDALQELAVLIGYGTKVREHKSTLSDKTVFSITFLTKGKGKLTLTHKRKVKYKGKVWCPTTHSSYWIARKNGSVFITGNSQTPFTNLTFDWVCPEDLRDQIPYIGSEEMPFSYGDLQAEMDMINRAFIEVMTEGDAKGRIFTFPIPTYNITPDFPWESPNTDLLFNMTARYGLPYFQSFLLSGLKPNMVRSMCCRLQLDLSELLKRGNGLFGSVEQTGSLGVSTINCARLGYLYKGNETGLYQQLDKLLILGKEGLEIKREVIQHYMDNGLFPFTKRYLGTLRNHFSTLGVNGINEMIRNFTDDQEDITTEWGQAFAIRLLDHIRAKMVAFQEETGHMYNLEATPAEGTTYRFAKEDKKRYPDILQAGTPEKPYYTNSSQLPVGFTDDPYEALEFQEELQSKYTGGCIAKGHKVITDKGAIKIEDIVNNFESLSPINALSYNPKTQQSEWDLITEAMIIDVEKHHKIKVVAGRGIEITTSDWHPFFVMEKATFSNQCPVCQHPLKSQNALAAHLRFHQTCQDDYYSQRKYQVIEKRADELKKGDYILQNTQNLLPETSTLNSTLAYFIGFFIGEGSITEDKQDDNNEKKSLVHFFSEDKALLEKIAHILSDFFKDTVKPLQNDNKPNEKRLTLSSNKKAVLDFLSQNHLLNENKKVNTIPSEVKHHLSKENFYSFLAGLIDSHGKLNERDGTIEYYTVSENLADDILEMCTIAGVLVSKHKKIAKKENEVDMYRVFISASQTRLLKEELPLLRSKDFIKEVLSSRLKRQLPVTKVLNTSKVEVQDNNFYDLTTAHNHNYLAGNNSFVFVHNTVLHLYMNERISSAQTCKNLVRRVLERYKVPYITVTPTFSICPVHGYLAGEHEFCPLCDEEVLVNKQKGEVNESK